MKSTARRAAMEIDVEDVPVNLRNGLPSTMTHNCVTSPFARSTNRYGCRFVGLTSTPFFCSKHN